MKSLKPALLALAALGGIAAAGAADAQHRYYHRHGGARVGVFVGSPFYPYYYPRYYYPPYAYYPPYTYYPPAVAVPAPAPASPPVYIEQSAPASGSAAPSQSGPAYWYYCQDARAYYPYVQKCPSQWQQVVPQSGPGPQAPQSGPQNGPYEPQAGP